MASARRIAAGFARVTAVVALVATSPRRWYLTSTTLQGNVELTASAPDVVHVFELSMPGFAGADRGVDLTLDVSASAAGARDATVEARFEDVAPSAPAGVPIPASGPALAQARTSLRCVRATPCVGRVRVTMRRGATDDAPRMVVWSVTGRARGMGDDPPSGTALTLRRVP